MFDVILKVPCLACSGEIDVLSERAVCNKCKSELRAMIYLTKEGLLPMDMYHEIKNRPKYIGITMAVAKMLVTIYNDNELPN